MSIEDVHRAARALEDDGLVEMQWMAAPIFASRFKGLSGETRRKVGQWPTPEAFVDRLIAALEKRIDNTADKDERSKLRRLLDSVTGISRDIAVDVAGSVLSGQIT